VEESGLPRENRRPVANHRGLQLKGPFDLNKERFLQNKEEKAEGAIKNGQSRDTGNIG
jgi:hypothetical protein